jgi:hypothetical protein
MVVDVGDYSWMGCEEERLWRVVMGLRNYKLEKLQDERKHLELCVYCDKDSTAMFFLSYHLA